MSLFSPYYMWGNRLSKVCLLAPGPQLRISITNLYSQIFIEHLLRARHIMALRVLHHLTLMTACDLLFRWGGWEPEGSIGYSGHLWVAVISHEWYQGAGSRKQGLVFQYALLSQPPARLKFISMTRRHWSNSAQVEPPNQWQGTHDYCPRPCQDLAHENNSEKGFVK